MKLGIDIGNGYTKVFNKELKFASAFERRTVLATGRAKGVHAVTLNGDTFLVGQGNSFLGKDRYFTLGYKLCMLTAIALSSEKSNAPILARVCVGLPLGEYKRGTSRKIIKEVMSWGMQEITVNGQVYNIEIQKITVYPEGALGVLEDEDEGTLLTIDLGAGTVNAVLWEDGEPVDEMMLPSSMNRMYTNIQEYITSLGGNHDLKAIEKLIGKDSVKINQVDTDISGHKAFIRETVESIYSDLSKKFTFSQIDRVKLLGGGAYPTLPYWKDLIQAVEISSQSQFVNAKIYQMEADEL